MACGLLFALIPQGSKLPELGNRQQATGNSEEKTLAVFFLTFWAEFHKNRARFLETEIALFLFKRIQYLGLELNNRRHFDLIIG